MCIARLASFLVGSKSNVSDKTNYKNNGTMSVLSLSYSYFGLRGISLLSCVLSCGFVWRKLVPKGVLFYHTASAHETLGNFWVLANVPEAPEPV